MHTVGFDHLHEREDRDEYIKVNKSNIDESTLSQFKKQKMGRTGKIPFEYDSLLLYGSIDFQKADLAQCDEPDCWTITTIEGERIEPMYAKQGPAPIDFQVINELYRCTKSPPPTTTPTPGMEDEEEYDGDDSMPMSTTDKPPM